MSMTGASVTAPSPQVLRSIAAASRQTGVSFGYLFNQAKSESAFDPDAKARTSSASGLYQFTRQTWLAALDAHGAEHGLDWAAAAIDRSPAGDFQVADPRSREAILELRRDPSLSAAMAAELASDNADFLSGQLGREVTSTDLALAHFLGAQGAAKFLTAFAQTPDAPAAPLFLEAAQANRTIFYDRTGTPRSIAQIHARFEATVGGEGYSPPPPSDRVVRHEISQETRSSGWSASLPGFEPMPSHLSVGFAEAAYRRLAAMGGSE